MAEYDIYKQKISFDKYFKTWNQEDVKQMSQEDKLEAYAKYKFRCEVLTRDNFMCQNTTDDKKCLYCNNEQFYPKLTAHHIKHQRNIKEKYTDEMLRKKLYSLRNAVTVCEGSHQAFNRYKIGLTFKNDHLPPHIKGHTFRLHKPLKLDMKELTIKGKEIKKQHKGEKYILTMKDIPLVLLLFRFLRIPYYEIGGEMSA